MSSTDQFADTITYRSDWYREYRHLRGVDEIFYLHVGAKVYAVVCEAGDLLWVPRGTAHWFDMGGRPEFTAIRFFEEEDGWIGNFLPDSIASGFPSLDELRAARLP